MSRKGKRNADRLKRIQAASAKRANSSNHGEIGPFNAASGLALAINAEDGGPDKLGTFSGIGYTGAPMKPMGFFYPIVCDLAGIRIRSQHQPALRQHDHEQIVGHTTSVKVDPKEGIKYEGVFSGEPENVRKVTIPAKNGFQWQLSIGADPIRKSFLEGGESTIVNGREVTGPMWVSHETDLGELSFVPLGADRDTSATINASAGRNNVDPKQALKFAMSLMAKATYSDEDIDAMDEEKAKAALKKAMKSADDDEDAEKKKKDEEEKAKSAGLLSIEAQIQKGIQAANQAAAANVQRIADIEARIAKHGVSEVDLDGKKINLKAHAIANNWTADQAELHALRASRPGAGVGVPGGLAYSTGNPILNDAVIEAAILGQAENVGDFQLFSDDFYKPEIDRETGVRIHGSRVTARERNKIKAELNDRYPDQVRQAARQHFKNGISLHQTFLYLAAQNGYRGGDMIRGESQLGEVMRYASMIRAEGTSTSSLPNLLANVLNKFLLQGYLFVEQAHKEISAVRSVRDFKPTKSVNLFGDTILKKLGPAGEISNATLYDQAFANQAFTYARIGTLPRTNIVNDDIGGLTTFPIVLGRGAGLAVNDVFWTLFLNPGKDVSGGSTDFFAATHTITGESGNSNYQSGAGTALSSSSLKDAVVLIDNQVDPKGFPLGEDAKILLVGPDTFVTGKELMMSDRIVMEGLKSTSAATKQPSTNIWMNEFKLVKSRYINKSAYTGNSTTAWWLFVEPSRVPVVEIAYLNGVDTPIVQTAGPDFQFDTLGISTRVVLDFGVAMQNWRGAVKSAGA